MQYRKVKAIKEKQSTGVSTDAWDEKTEEIEPSKVTLPCFDADVGADVDVMLLLMVMVYGYGDGDAL